MTLWRVTHKGTNPQRYHLSHCQNKNTELHWASWWRNADGSVAHHTWSNRPNRTTHPTHSPRQKDMGDLWKWRQVMEKLWLVIRFNWIHPGRWGKKNTEFQGWKFTFQASNNPYQQFISEQSPFTVAVYSWWPLLTMSNSNLTIISQHHLQSQNLQVLFQPESTSSMSLGGFLPLKHICLNCLIPSHWE